MLNNQSVVVTGAASGLGLAIARQIVEAGAHVALVDKDAVGLRVAQSELGENARAFMCDIRDHTDVAQLACDVIEWMPTIDILINNAAVWTDNEIEAVDPARRKLAFETNVVGNMHVTEAFLPTLRAQQAAHIFNVISVAGDILSPAGDNRLWSTYGATKWALAGYTKTLREQLAETSIRVSGLFPGGIDTNFYENAGKTNGTHDQPWMMRAEDVADIVLFMLTRPHDVHIESLTVVKA